jgi:FkbM family methyltransferase
MANLRYIAGALLGRSTHAVLASRLLPTTRYVPLGLSAFYDIQRFNGVRDVGVIFDVGANTGQTAWGLTKYFRRSEIYCFEPVAATHAILERNYGRKARCVKMALGRQIGVKTIQLFSDSELNTFSEARGAARPLGSETVPVTTVDHFCADNGITQVGLLKLDVQGWELEVLEGARGMLDRRAIRFIFAEVGFRDRDTDMQAFAPLNDHLGALGYELCGFYDPFRWGKAKSILGFANALYILPPRPDGA